VQKDDDKKKSFSIFKKKNSVKEITPEPKKPEPEPQPQPQPSNTNNKKPPGGVGMNMNIMNELQAKQTNDRSNSFRTSESPERFSARPISPSPQPQSPQRVVRGSLPVQAKTTQTPPSPIAIKPMLQQRSLTPQPPSTKPLPTTTLQKSASSPSFGGITYDQLKNKVNTDALDQNKLESYLSDSEFEQVMSCSKDEFYKMPLWKQNNKKRMVGLV